MTLALAMLALSACSSSGSSSGSSPSASPDGASAPDAAHAVDPPSTPRADGPTGPTPTVTGPVTGGQGVPNSAAPAALLSAAGYQEDEWLVSGQATSYQPTGTWAADGVWSASPAATAPYVTRALVRRPTSPAKFNGVVVVEWLNVSAGGDVAVDFGYLNRELLDQGYIYVGITAQKVGLDAAKGSDPARYPTLSHPGDDFSYDMFTQAGRAVLAHALFPTDFGIEQLIADGESQSAGRMTTYIDAVQPLADVYDGFLVHSRGDRMTPIAAGQPSPGAPLIRTDLRTPTLVVLTETDVLGNQGSKQDDSDRYRRWEIAGSAHVDNYDLSVLYGSDPTKPSPIGGSCVQPINTGRQYLVMNAGLRHLVSWIGGGDAPPSADRLTITADGTYATDAHGNALGGIRLPDVEAPIATLKGLGNDPNFCRLFGITTAFDASQLQALYPDHAAYVSAFRSAVDRLVDQGFALDRDAAEATTDADAAPVPPAT